MEIPRIVEAKPENDVAKMMAMILALPRVKTHAVTVFPGQGENCRLESAVKWWKASRSNHLFVAGTEWKEEKTTVQPTVALLQAPPYNLSDSDLERTEIQEHAHITPDQTKWVVQMVKKWEIQSIGLVAPTYHVVRAYLTLLKEFLKIGRAIPIIPLPVPISPSTISPENQVDFWTMMDGEIARIIKYQGQDYQNVATLEELKPYLAWLWKQPLLAH